MMDTRGPTFWLTATAGIFALSAASVIGWWHLDAAPELGAPVVQMRWLTVYAPWSAIDWWQAWSYDPGFRAQFRRGAQNAAIFSLLAGALGLHMVRTFGPLEHAQTEDQPHRYGTVSDLLRSKRISVREKGIVLGLHGRKIVYHTGDDHVLLIGASRVGEKGVSFIMPTLADCQDSMVVFDPKGELHEATADERAKLGPVFLWDPTRPGTHQYNPLLELRGDERNIGDCRALGMLMTVGMEGKDPFWATKAAELAAAVTRVVCVDGGPRTLERMRQIALGIATNRRPACSDQWAMDIIDEHMARSPERGVRPGVEAQLLLALATAGDPIGAAATAASDFQIADLCADRRPVTVYVTLPASQHESLKHMARIVLQGLLIGMLHDRRVTSDGRRKRHRVMWLIDEFPALGYIPFIEHGMAVAAGHGLKMFLVAQDIAQIERTYGSKQSLVGNAGTFVWVPSMSKETYEHAASVAGTMIANMRARHRKVGVMDRPSETASQSRHPVINPREAQLMGRDHALIMHAGAHPTWLRKARFYQLPRHYGGRILDTHVRYDA